MAYVNVREWSPDQVTEWLRGLDNVILPYINSFLNNEVKGHQLLNLRSDDLEHLGVYTLGHQELILEAVEHLRSFHYELDRENLQFLALKLSCASRSLYNELLSSEDSSKIETQTMADVANIISTIKPLVCWLDRAPFSGQSQYLDRKIKLLQLSLEMATSAHRDRFADQPVEKIRTSCNSLANLADDIIQEISDPMLLQPASLDLATLKKKENELGFSLMPSFHGIHQIAEIKFTSPAHTNSKLEDGDEIVQVNYQTVVGWQRKKVLGLFQESPPDIVLTLKKRPRHTKVYGQIYMKPYRLPSKKRATPYSRWNDNLPSPRPELLTIPDFEMPLPRLPPVIQTQPLESESSSDSEPPDSPLESQGRVYPLKPRPVLQRRNTITGASPTSKRPLHSIEQLWNELKHQAAYKHSSSTYIETDNYKPDTVYLRDKSASCGHGLELTQRPATYPKKFDKSLLITHKPETTKNTDNNKKRVNFEEKKNIIIEEKKEILDEENNLEKSISVNSLSSISQSDEPIKFIDETVDEMYDRSHMNAFEWKNEIIEEIIGRIKKNVITNQGEMIPPQTKIPPAIPVKPEILKKPAVPPRNFTTKLVTRGRLDKSYSTPAYDTTSQETEIKPTIKTPEILISSHETTEIIQENLTTTPVVETINTALQEFRNDPDIIQLSKPCITPKISDTPPEPPPRTIYNITSISTTQQLPSNEIPSKLKHFEPKSISTPITKSSGVDFPIIEQTKTPEIVLKNTSDLKISPTNSVVRAMMSKNKTGKKKNTLLAKRRKVSVKELTPCDMQGYLYQRLRNKQTQNFHWEKRWFILSGSCLYGFKSNSASKAECLIFLTGFTVAIAYEIKSRLNPFKVYHTGTAFYFSADNSETMTSWVELITAATLHSDGGKPQDGALFSDTDDSETEKPKTENKEKVETSRKFGSLKKFTSKKINSDHNNTGHSESTSLDRKYLRFFNNSGSKGGKNQMPVPTPQFRSYRKVVPPNLVVNQSASSNSSNKKIEIPPKSPEIHITKPEPETSTATSSLIPQKSTKLKPKPLNYIHASNPSLCDINDYRLQSFYHHKTRQFTQRQENLAGFVTLEQFMLNRQEEERKQNLLFGRNEEAAINPNSIQPDVVYGEIRTLQSGDSRTFDNHKNKKASSDKKLTHARNNSDGYTDLYYKKSELVSDIKISEPYQLQYADKKSLRNNEEKSYEMIYCSQKKVNGVQFAQNRTLEPQKKQTTSSKLTRQHSLNSADKLKEKSFNRGQSPEKFWLESLRRTDKVFDKSSSKVKLKSATQYTPMCLPLTPDQKGKLNPKFAFELNLDEKSSSSSSSSNNNKTSKFKNLFGGKSDDKKEKTILGSPRLHRALFRKPNQTTTEATDWTSEIPQVIPLSTNNLSPQTGIIPSPHINILTASPPDYPGLEYPPIFEPETYSLANPSCNLTLLRKQQQNK